MIRTFFFLFSMVALATSLKIDSQGEMEVSMRGRKAYCKLDPNHTMCLYKKPSKQCKKSSKYRKVNKAGQKIVVDAHNALRRKVASGGESPQPAASNMREIVWNDELAKIAQRWTDQCQFGHDQSRNKLDGTYVGQNAYMGGGMEKSLDELMSDLENGVKAWYSEVSVFDPASISPFSFNYEAGHYTQVVWADTEEVGCGFNYYQDQGWWWTLFICNYAVGGNMRGATMYKIGDACSACPDGYSCNEGLCAK